MASEEFKIPADDKKSEIKELPKPGRINLPIVDKDLNNYFESIVDDRHYMEEISINDNKMKVTYRTRSVDESNEIISTISKEQPQTNADLDLKMAQYNLAYSLVQIWTNKGTQKFDFGTFKERLDRIGKFQGTKYLILIEGLFAFEDKTEKMRKKIIDKNF